ncbi:hypothetical protein DBV05_g10711 [Lasiodiplodia theobromae]|uniref:F-box domain-containing protein n=1 Tax=Lasiodiplodia theobromae TaxID=45133 RepID=A0A5N5CZ38_9PEZI|nr:hypothetical protein DBV05_g10711 [Lasiodiplodia theobromae]
MTSLPQELLERIVSFADRQTNANLLTVSRNFHVAVERVEFPRSIDVNCHNLDKLLELYHGHRLALLRKVTFEVSFPELKHSPEAPLACRETPEDLQAMDKDFTRQIKALFTALDTLQERASSSSSESQLRRLSLEIQMARQTDDGNKPCHHRRFTSWRLHLLDPDTTLPALPSVHSFRFQAKSHTHYSPFDHQIRPVDLCAILAIIAKLPNLEDLDLPYLYERPPPCHYDAICDHYDKPWPGPLRDARHDFARRILSSSPASPFAPSGLRTARLHFFEVQQHGPSFDQRCRRGGKLLLPDLVHPLPSDPLSAALRRFSQGLVELDLRATADETLFWPASTSLAEGEAAEEEGEGGVGGEGGAGGAGGEGGGGASGEGAEMPYWPRLKSMRVELNIARPDGSYWFTGRQSDDSSSSNERGYPVDSSSSSSSSSFSQHYPPIGPDAADEEWDRVWNREWAPRTGCGMSGMESVREYVFRIAPAAEHVERLLTAFARAVRRMPVLREAQVFSVLTNEECRDREDEDTDEWDSDILDVCDDEWHIFVWGVRYVVDDGGERSVEWRVGDDGWRPGREVLDGFGEGVRHVWLPTKYSMMRMMNGRLHGY